MPCYHPVKGYKAKNASSRTGKYRIVYKRDPAVANIFAPISHNCGGCIHCRLSYAMDWSIRIHHESQSYKHNWFLTLTYNSESLEKLPNPKSLHHKDFQDFMKRLRKAFPDNKLKFFMCGEYGTKKGRPHFHAIVFNLPLSDLQFHKKSGDFDIFTSQLINNVWKRGFVYIGTVTQESAGYVARYVTKKKTGKLAKKHYERVDPETGEIYSITPEYAKMSTREAIGKNWIKKYLSSVYPNDHIIDSNFKRRRVPRYYDKFLEKVNPQLFEQIKKKRVEEAKLCQDNQDPYRLDVMERKKYLDIRKLLRKLDDEL